MKARSFNMQLGLVLFGVIALCWIVVLAVVLTYFSRSKVNAWDSKLQTIAEQLLMTVPADSNFDDSVGPGPGLRLRDQATAGRDPLIFQIWFERRIMVARTPETPTSPLHPDFSDGPASATVSGNLWRIYSVTDSTGRVNVQVGNLQSVINADLRREAMNALTLATILLLIAGVIMWFVTQHALRSVKVLGSLVRNRRNLDLTPVPFETLPRELHSLIHSFNHLLKQVDDAVEGERRFIGDAAHELRTPLSAFQSQVEIALQTETLEDKDQALKKLLLVARRCARLSEQLLDLASVNASAKLPQHGIADLRTLVMHVAQEFEVYASQQGRSLYLDVHACNIRCNINEIGILLRNLIDNAMRYTSEGGNVLVGCGFVAETGDEVPKRVYLEIKDDGPGVPASDRDAIFVRFHRVAGTPVRGSGIGLSLVAGIADLHHATIETDTGLDGRGLTVRVVFPAINEAPVTSKTP